MKEVVFLGGKSIGASCLENLLKRRSDLGYEVAPVLPTPEGEQAQGIEVVHLGHNRSVDDIVRAAIQEDADGIAVSSYQGGHNEFFRYMIDRLREFGAGHIKVFGGGGGTITPEEIKELMNYGVERIYHPHDGMQLGLQEMINDLVKRTVSSRRHTTIPKNVERD